MTKTPSKMAPTKTVPLRKTAQGAKALFKKVAGKDEVTMTKKLKTKAKANCKLNSQNRDLKDDNAALEQENGSLKVILGAVLAEVAPTGDTLRGVSDLVLACNDVRDELLNANGTVWKSWTTIWWRRQHLEIESLTIRRN